MNADQLRHDLHLLAERAPSPPVDLAETVLARRRGARLQRAGLAGAVLAVVLVVAGVPLALGGTDARQSDPAAPPAPAADVYGTPTRGSLAGDRGFVEEVLRLPWSDPGFESDPAPPEAARRVAFAGDVAGGRWALVVGPAQVGSAASDGTVTEPGTDTVVPAAWFVGPAGSAPEQLTRYRQSPGLDPDLPTALLDSSTGALVVLAAPGDEIEVSRRPEVDAAGVVARTYDPVPAPDGAAVLALEPGELLYDPAVRYRVVRQGVVVAETGPLGHPNPAALQDPDLAISAAHGSWATDTDVVRALAESSIGQTGLRSEQLDLTVQWAGEVPGPDGLPATAALLTATFPSGAVLLQGAVSWTTPDGGSLTVDCARELQPAGRPADDRSYAVVCSPGEEGDEPPRTLIAVGGRLTATTGDVPPPVGTGGVVVTAAPDDPDALRLLDADGDVVPLSGTTSDLGR